MIELGKYDIHYHPRPTMKAQALADFLVECGISDEESMLEPLKETRASCWILHMDGASISQACETRLIFTSPEGVVMEYAPWFDFIAFNNEIEYEVLFVGLGIAKELGVKDLRIFTHSQFIIE